MSLTKESAKAASRFDAPTTPYPVPAVMRALVLEGVGFDHIRIAEVPVPVPGPRQLLARVDAAGICTSLIKIIEQGPSHSQIYGWDVTRYPLILGDEGSVTIVKVGQELASAYRAGQRFVIQPAVDHEPINHRERYRDNARGVSKVAVGYTLSGHLAEYVLIPEEVLEAGCLLPVSDPSFPYAHASMSEPFSCCISAQDHHLHLSQDEPLSPRKVTKGLKPGGVTIVVGAGAMGRMHVDLAMTYRPAAIVVADVMEERLEIVRRLLGPRAEQRKIALHLINPAKAGLKEAIDGITAYRGADDIIVAVGSRPVIEAAQALAGRGAVLNLFGGLKKGEDGVTLDAGIVHYKEINVTGSSGGSPWDIQRTLELMMAREIDAGAHITRVGDLDHALEFIRMVKAQTIDGKAIVYPHRSTSEIRAVSSWGAEDERLYLQKSGQ